MPSAQFFQCSSCINGISFFRKFLFCFQNHLIFLLLLHTIPSYPDYSRFPIRFTVLFFLVLLPDFLLVVIIIEFRVVVRLRISLFAQHNEHRSAARNQHHQQHERHHRR